MPHFHTRTICPPRTILQAVPWRCDQRSCVVTASDCWLNIYELLEDATFTSLAQQPVYGVVRKLAAIPNSTPGTCGDEELALLTDSEALTILKWDAFLERLVVSQRLQLPSGHPSGPCGTFPPTNPYRLLAVHPAGCAVAVAATFGVVAVFSLSTVSPNDGDDSPHSNTAGHLGGACPAGPAHPGGAACAAGLFGQGSDCACSVSLTVTGGGQFDPGGPPSTLRSIAWLGDEGSGGCSTGGTSRVVVLHQPPDSSLQLTILRYVPPARRQGSAVHPPAMRGRGPQEEGGRGGAGGRPRPEGDYSPPPPPTGGSLGVEAVVDLDDSLHLRLLRWQGSMQSGWGAGAVREVLPCPSAPGWVLLLQRDSLWLLRLAAGEGNQGAVPAELAPPGKDPPSPPPLESRALYLIAHMNSLVTCLEWDHAGAPSASGHLSNQALDSSCQQGPGGEDVAGAGAGAGGVTSMDLACTARPPSPALGAQQAQLALAAPADVDMADVAAPAELALVPAELAPPPAPLLQQEWRRRSASQAG